MDTINHCPRCNRVTNSLIPAILCKPCFIADRYLFKLSRSEPSITSNEVLDIYKALKEPIKLSSLSKAFYQSGKAKTKPLESSRSNETKQGGLTVSPIIR